MKHQGSLKLFLFFLILIFSLILRFYKLSEIPGEWFGDISNVHEYVGEILKGNFPVYFFQSPGPFYHYFVAPIVFLFSGQGYDTYKIASTVISILFIWGTYLFVSEWFTRRIALVSVWLISFSFWPLVWSRLGNSQVIIPAIFSFGGYFFLLFVKRRKRRYLLASLVISSLGLYTYPQTFIFPFIFLLSYLGFYFMKKEIVEKKFEIMTVVVLLFYLAVPFIFIVRNEPYNFGSGGYVGRKVLPVLLMNPVQAVKTELNYFVSTLNMFYLKGDYTFRVNVPDTPIIDTMSFIFLLLGISYYFIRKKYFRLLYRLIIVCLLLFPATLPGIPSGEIPSSSRTIAVQPIIYTLISLGMVFFISFFQKKGRRKNLLIGAVVLTGFFISFSNLNKYFILYPKYLPDGNLSYGKKIAEYLDREVPTTTAVYFGSCCWGAHLSPEPKGVAYVIRKPRVYIGKGNISSCQNITRFPSLVIFSPKDSMEILEYKKCFSNAKIGRVNLKSGEVLFQYIQIPSPG